MSSRSSNPSSKDNTVADQEDQNTAVPTAPNDVPETPVITPAAVVAEAAPEPERYGEQTRDIFVPAVKGKAPTAGPIHLANETYNETVDKLNAMPNVDWAKSESGR